MINFIQFFCVSIALCFAAEAVELQFFPNEIAEITSSKKVTKEVAIQGNVNTFVSDQELNMDLFLNEEPAPFSFTLILNEFAFKSNKNGEKVSFDTIENAEAKSLIGRPLKFVSADRNQPIKLVEEQSKLFGDYQVLSPKCLEGFLEDGIQDLLLLADVPLKVGEKLKLSKSSGPLAFDVIYTVKEITPESITATYAGNLNRTKIKELPMLSVASGEMHGEIVWNRKNNLYFSCNEQGNFRYTFKQNEQESSVELHLSKTIASRPKIDGNR